MAQTFVLGFTQCFQHFHRRTKTTAIPLLQSGFVCGCGNIGHIGSVYKVIDISVIAEYGGHLWFSHI